jgi:hypothetical protein
MVGYAAVDHVHWGSTDTPLDGVTITWRSDEGSSAIKWGYTGSYEKGSSDGKRRSDKEGNLYDYTFPRLTPSSTVHYRIAEGASWTADRTFRTSTDTASTHYTFIAGGDSRAHRSGGNPTQWGQVASALEKQAADFHLYMGDVVYSGGSYSDWKKWYSYGEGFIGKNLVYHCYGNHDTGSIYTNQFVLPGNEKYYAFEFGHTLFVCLDSQSAGSSTQYQWLLAKLESSAQAWKIVWFHKPFYTGSKHPQDMWGHFDTWWKAFDDYGVDVVLGGHCHNYMRSKPINRNVSTNSPVSEYGSEPGQGRLQIIAGGYGAGNSSRSSGWFVAETSSAYHYCRFEINGLTLTLNTYKIDGTKIDTLTYTKSGPAAPPVITRHPQSVTTSEGEPATFTVEASGTGTLHYQWYEDGVPVGTDAAVHTISSTTLAQNGRTYHCVVTDDNGSSQSKPATLTVKQNEPPVAADQTVATVQGVAVAVELSYSDPDGGTGYTVTVTGGPSNGTLLGSGAGRTYAPDSGFSGTDSFTWKVSDGKADSNEATVTITVEPDSDGDGLPDSWETSYGLDPNAADTDGNGVADPDEDPDGDGLTNLEEYLRGSDPTVASGTSGGSGGFSCLPGGWLMSCGTALAAVLGAAAFALALLGRSRRSA